MIKQIQYDQNEIINNIISLYIKNGAIEVDATYSKGNFYKNNNIQEPIYKFDISPQDVNVVKADCRELPLQNESVGSIMFDPPFLATTGPSLRKNDDSNIIAKRFGTYKNEIELHQMYFDSMKEFYRILKPGGILIVKCQDKVSSGKQYMQHVYIMNMAEDIGYYTKDMFILCVNNRLVANWQKNQKHARKYHSYFYVFEKPIKKDKIKINWDKSKRCLCYE